MWLSLIVLGLMPLGATAQECGNTFGMDYENINAEADLDDLNDSCTILLSRYRITNNFTEPFVLPGIINASDITGGSAGRALSIPSFEMPDLEHIDDLSLVRLDQLETFDVPKLMSARAIRLGSDATMALEMPALEEVSVMELKGNLTALGFPALRSVEHDLVVANSRIFDSAFPVETIMNVSFPLLNSSESIFVIGRASSVSFPELTSLADPWALNYHPGSNFSLWGEAVALNLPKLATVDGSVAFEGNFSSLSLSSLDYVQENFTITTGNPISIDLPELGFAGVIRVTGQVDSIKLPRLVNWYELHVDTDLTIDCDAFLEEFDMFPDKRVTTCVSRGGTVEESNGDEGDDSTAMDEESSEESQDENADGRQDGDENSSTSLAGKGIAALVASSLLTVGVVGLL